MMGVDQEFLAGETAIAGDCWRACIATLFNLDRANTPHFVEQYDAEWLEATQEWLETNHNYLLQITALPAEDTPIDRLILVGGSPRDGSHAVIGDLRGNLVHDPHPSRAGLVSTQISFKAIRP